MGGGALLPAPLKTMGYLALAAAMTMLTPNRLRVWAVVWFAASAWFLGLDAIPVAGVIWLPVAFLVGVVYYLSGVDPMREKGSTDGR